MVFTVAHKYKHAYKFKYTNTKPNTRIQKSIHANKSQYTHTKLNTRIQNSIHANKSQYTHTKLNARIQNSMHAYKTQTLEHSSLHDVSTGNEQNECRLSIFLSDKKLEIYFHLIKLTTMFCSHCGQEKDKNANFCKSCGASVSENKSSPSSSTSQQPLSFKEYLEKKSEAGGSSSSAGSVDTSAFKNIKKRKKNERLSQIKQEKKDEIVKVYIFTNILKYTKYSTIQYSSKNEAYWAPKSSKKQ